MKYLLTLIAALFICCPAFAQISETHRGYDISAKSGDRVSSAKDNQQKQNSDAATKHNLYLIFSPGIMQSRQIKLDKLEFNNSEMGQADLALQYYPYKYLGLGIGTSYYSGSTDEKEDVFVYGDRAAVRHTTWGFSLLMLGRYPMKFFEPYLSAGITYNINYIARDYTNNTDSENGNSVGCILDAGIRWFAFEPAFIGISIRQTYNFQGSDNSQNVDLGGTTLFFNIGYSI